MKTKILHISSADDQDNLIEAAEVLKAGGLVAFPTETVYGIGANALDVEVARKIYEAKGRPSDNPLIVHLCSASQVNQYVEEIPEVAYPLMETFWPGPLTMIFRKSDRIPDEITGGLPTVALRIPSHDIAFRLIELSGLPIAAPSANISGKPSPTIASHVIEDLSGRVDMIVDGGDVEIGLESTVLDLTGDVPMVLRPGGITQAMIEEVIGDITHDRNMLSVSADEVPRSPGMKYRHYAPKGKLTVYNGDSQSVIDAINEAVRRSAEEGLKAGVIATDEDIDAYVCENVVTIGSEHRPAQIAANLFKVLRMMDDLGIERIFTKAFHEKEIGVATMNRLLKAAGNEQVFV